MPPPPLLESLPEPPFIPGCGRRVDPARTTRQHGHANQTRSNTSMLSENRHDEASTSKNMHSPKCTHRYACKPSNVVCQTCSSKQALHCAQVGMLAAEAPRCVCALIYALRMDVRTKARPPPLTALCRRMMSTAGERLSLEKQRAGHRPPSCRPATIERKSLQVTFPLSPHARRAPMSPRGARCRS